MTFAHYLTDVNGQTSFEHRVTIIGPFTGLFRKLFANKMAAKLPAMITQIARFAEKNEAK